MHQFVRTLLPGVVLLLSAASGPRLETRTPSAVLLVLSKADKVLSIVDPSTGTVLGQIPSGPDPHEVVASADGKRAYISNYGSGAFNTITVVDLVGQKALATIDLGALRGPHGIEFAAGKVWFTAEAADAIGSIDPSTNKVDWVLGTGQRRTHMLAVSADAKRVLTTNVNSATVSIIEEITTQGRPDWNFTVVPVGAGAEGFDVTPDGKQAWIANATDGTISVIDLTTKRVVQTLDADVKGANRLKFTPDGALAFVSSLRSPDVTVLRVSSRAVVKRIPVGRGAAGILIQPDGARAYIACTPDDKVVVVDVKSLSVVKTIVAGKQPDGLAWAMRP